MRKKITVLVICIVAIIALFGCASSTDGGHSEKHSERDSSTNDVIDVEQGDKEIYAFKEQHTLTGMVAIGESYQLFLKTDGTVVGKGDSSYGVLGNGSREYCEEWTAVSELSDIKKIFSSGSKSNELDNVYALSNDGTLYEWGNKILKPRQILSNVKDIWCCGQRCYMIEYLDNHFEIMLWGTLVDVTDYVKDSEVIYAGLGLTLDYGCHKIDDPNKEIGPYIVIKNNSGLSSLIELKIQETKEINDKYNYADIISTVEYEIGNNVEKVTCVAQDGNSEVLYAINNEGAVFSFTIEDGAVKVVKEPSGRGYRNYYSNSKNTIALLGNKVNTLGDNKDGQLGDGTNLDYYEDYLEIDKFECNELYTRRGKLGRFCIALDTQDNIWCWGGTFGNEPKMLSGELGDEY